MIDILIIDKCHTDPRFINNDYLTLLFITLKVQDNITFFEKVFLSHFCDFIFGSARHVKYSF